MKINISNIKIGDVVYAFDMGSGTDLIYPIKVNQITEIESGKYMLHDDITINIADCKLFTDLTEAIDLIRTSNYIRDFDVQSMGWYREFLTEAIDKKYPIYVIREKKYGSPNDRYVDECIILSMYYDGSGKWKLKIKSKNESIIKMHHASSLGLKIFFNKNNAISKLNSLRSGLN